MGRPPRRDLVQQAAGASAGVEQPMFLLGPARSGTSLLYRMLCLHPRVAYISNFQRRLPGFAPVAGLDRLPRRLPGMRRAIWFPDGSNAYVYGRRRSWRERVFPAPVEGESVFARCGIPEAPPAAGMPVTANPLLAAGVRAATPVRRRRCRGLEAHREQPADPSARGHLSRSPVRPHRPGRARGGELAGQGRLVGGQLRLVGRDDAARVGHDWGATPGRSAHATGWRSFERSRSVSSGSPQIACSASATSRWSPIRWP